MGSKKLLGIVASYRKNGNGEIVVKAVAEKLGDGWELSLVRLPKLKVEPCKGCYACLLPNQGCLLKDDVEWLFEQMKTTDAVIFSAPNYVLGPVGIVKMLADRALQAASYPMFQKIKTAAVLTLGKETYRGYADTALASQISALGLSVVHLSSFLGTHPGEIALEDNFEEKIIQMAESLQSETSAESFPDTNEKKSPNRCPHCMSDLFRVHPDRLECAICKSTAIQEGGKLRFVSFHPEFSEEGRMKHMEWLLMKKAEYKGLKVRLREIQERYPEGNWLSPIRPS